MTPPVSDSVRNRLLASLAPAHLARLRPHLEPVSLSIRQTLSMPGQPIEHAYFVERGMVSLVACLADGSLIEVGVIDREGCFGAAVLHGGDPYPAEAMVQVAGSALRIRVAVLQQEADRNSALARLLFRFTHALHIQ